MMSSIQARLRLLLASVVVLCALTTLVGVGVMSRGSFERFITNTDRERATLIAHTLENVYESKGTIKNFESFFPLSQNNENQTMTMMSGMSGMGQRMMGFMGIFPERVIVTDEAGAIVDDNAPDEGKIELPPNGGIPITAKGRVVGYVSVGSMLSPSLSPFQQDFLRSLGLSILLSSVVSVLVAFLLGSLLVRTITSPLKQFSAAVSTIAGGNFSIALPPKGYTELKELALNINSMSSALHDADVWRKQLIADIAHELRTPLTLIQGTLEAMVDGMYPLSMENATTLFEETKHLSRLVEDLRELSSLEKGEPRFENSPIDLPETVQSVADSFLAALTAKQIRWELSVSAKLPLWFGDQGRLIQVLQNLFSNAVKYCPEGSIIYVSLSFLEARSHFPQGVLRLDFSDNGQGIPAGDVPHIFERFYRVDKSRARDTGGTGLGLSIVKGIVEGYSGTVEAFSPALLPNDHHGTKSGGPGTTIRIELPIMKTL